jgi:hypothetical protein
MKKFNTRFRNENLIATVVIATVFLLTAALSILVYAFT